MASVKTAGLNAQVDVLSDNDEAVFTPTGKIQYNVQLWQPNHLAFFGTRRVNIRHIYKIKHMVHKCTLKMSE